MQDLLTQIFRAFYLQFIELSLNLILDAVVSITTHLILLYAPTALGLLRSLGEVGRNLLESIRLKRHPKNLVRLKLRLKNDLQISRPISIMKILASIIAF